MHLDLLKNLYNLWYGNKFDDFKKTLVSQDFIDPIYFDYHQEIYDFWMNAFSDDFSRLSSNQTHNGVNHYLFAPISGIYCVENFFKNFDIVSCFFNGCYGSNSSLFPINQQYCSFGFKFNFLNPCFESLNDFKGNLRTYPQILMFLSKEKEFIDTLARGNISLISCTGYDADFPMMQYKNRIHINDNMINWKTGENFLTCKKGNKHTFPFSIKKDGLYGNLLNMYEKRMYESDDFFELDFTECECGLKWPKVSRFESHINIKNKPEKISLEPLVGQYINFQIAKDNRNDFFYFISEKNGDIPSEDLNYIFGNYKKGKIYRDKQLIVGSSKIPFFCGINDSINYQIVPKKPIKFL
jgi:hypothetical protein